MAFLFVPNERVTIVAFGSDRSCTNTVELAFEGKS